MKKYILLSILSLMLSANIYADSFNQDYCCPTECCFENEHNFYANVFAGANFLQIEGRSHGVNTKVGYAVSGSIGYRIACGFRVEGEYAYRRNSLKTRAYYADDSSYVHANAHHQTNSFMANVLYDLPLTFECIELIPFVGAGIGYDSQKTHASARISDVSHSDSHTKGMFAWQFLTGVAYPLCDNTQISVEYKLHKGTKYNLYNHSIGAGLTYNFG